MEKNSPSNQKRTSGVAATFKSNDTEEWLDRVWTRPIGYLWACFFRRLHVHPNTVTVMSMIIGAASSLFFACGSWYYEGSEGLVMNIIGVLLLAWANFYDSADGQLARMTGQKTRLGRIGYTQKQECATPQFQHLLARLTEVYGAPSKAPQAFRDRFRQGSLPLMKWTNILTFNTRAIVLYTVCLLDVPVLYFVFEIVVMTALCLYMRAHHEALCKKLSATLS